MRTDQGPILAARTSPCTDDPFRSAVLDRRDFAAVVVPGFPPVGHATSGWTLSCHDRYVAIHATCGRCIVECAAGVFVRDGDPLELVDRLLTRLRAANTLGLPFEGGFVGYLAYEALDPSDIERHQTPDLWLAFPRRFRIDRHDASCATEVELTGLPEPATVAADLGFTPSRLGTDEAVTRARLEPRRGHSLPSLAGMRPSTDREQFIRAVLECQEYIRAGDIYQANISYPLVRGLTVDPRLLAVTLHEHHPTPHAAFVDCGHFQLVGASPELFLRRRGDRVVVRPIKGTRRRSEDSIEDTALRGELATDTKEAAEHVMIVDLERNDLGRVARTGSVRVSEFAQVESFGTLHHLVSTVGASCRAGLTVAEILRATFPCGSVTGAPKVRARQIIRELEGRPRGPYTGATGWIDARGDMELAVAIRTAVVADECLEYGVGAGIVADSDPEAEWCETLLKAEALSRALRVIEPDPPGWTEATPARADSDGGRRG